MDQGIKRRIAASVPAEEFTRLDRDGPAAAAMKPHKSALLWHDLATKHPSIIVGVVLAYAFRDPPLADHLALSIVAGGLSVLTLASANYVLREWLNRIDIQALGKQADATLISVGLFGVFSMAGLLLASQLGRPFLWTAVVFLCSGMIYQVPRFQPKDAPNLHVIVESIRHPIQFTLGWMIIDPLTSPPIYLVLAFWTAAAFLAWLPKSHHSSETAANIRSRRFAGAFRHNRHVAQPGRDGG
ncbi:hypothetical protein ABIE78_002920 [Sinorhizobium fredii]|uniref:hypothetical protein n=1 Tax=Rhizobium fredii TaxID=380 RepID=UPI00069462C9|nr:hypothetical protein [Sinorhizobium fredii]